MSNSAIKRRSIRLATAAAGVAALGIAALVTIPASAEEQTWSHVAKADASFECVSNDCEAGGVGPVAKSARVWSDAPRNPFGGQIGAWERTVHIKCKLWEGNPENFYHVYVEDTNWAGEWEILNDDLKNGILIDESDFPLCGE